MALDHAGIIYPYIARSGWNEVFRLEAELDITLTRGHLEDALSALRVRFPSFFVTLVRGSFSYYLRRTQELPRIRQGLAPYCEPFDLENSSLPLFRILYSGSHVALELFHSVADGHGAIVFFTALLDEYCRISSGPAGHAGGTGHFTADDRETLAGDKFLDVSREGGSHLGRSESKAYQYNNGIADCDLHVTTFAMPADRLRYISRSMGATVTVLLAAIYTKALLLSSGSHCRSDIKIEIPVDLRRRFGLDTIRNFSLYFNTNVPFISENSELPSITDYLVPQFRSGTDIQKLRDGVFTNVSDSQMRLFRVLPVALKQLALKAGFSLYGERVMTSPLSNLGAVSVPDTLAPHIKYLGFIIGKTLKNTIYSGVVTCGGTAYWNVSSVVDSYTAENFIEKIIREAGIDPVVTKK